MFIKHTKDLSRNNKTKQTCSGSVELFFNSKSLTNFAQCAVQPFVAHAAPTRPPKQTKRFAPVKLHYLWAGQGEAGLGVDHVQTGSRFRGISCACICIFHFSNVCGMWLFLLLPPLLPPLLPLLLLLWFSLFVRLIWMQSLFMFYAKGGRSRDNTQPATGNWQRRQHRACLPVKAIPRLGQLTLLPLLASACACDSDSDSDSTSTCLAAF